MTKYAITDITDEILIFLRNHITDPNSRGSDTTDTFSGDDSTTQFTLTESGVKNVKSVKIGGSAKTFGTDYTVTYDPTSTVVTFTTPPPSGTNNIEIEYHYGNTWIYPDKPLKQLSLDSFPRISLTHVSGTFEEMGLNADMTKTDLIYSITAYAKTDNEVRDLINQVKNAFIDNKKSFHNLDL